MPSINKKNLMLDDILTDGEGTRSLTVISNLDSADESDNYSPVKRVTFDPNNRFNVAGKWGGVFAFFSFQFNFPNIHVTHSFYH